MQSEGRPPAPSRNRFMDLTPSEYLSNQTITLPLAAPHRTNKPKQKKISFPGKTTQTNMTTKENANPKRPRERTTNKTKNTIGAKNYKLPQKRTTGQNKQRVAPRINQCEREKTSQVTRQDRPAPWFVYINRRRPSSWPAGGSRAAGHTTSEGPNAMKKKSQSWASSVARGASHLRHRLPK